LNADQARSQVHIRADCHYGRCNIRRVLCR
jgi:hypothetical protein